MDIPWQEMFAPTGSPGRTYERFAEESGRVEAIWFPFTDKPWLKIWSPTPVKPPESREVFGPYNYFFTDNLPEPLTDLLGQVAGGIQAATPAFGVGQLAAVQAGLALTDTDDLWGWSKDVLFYLRHTTMRVTAGGGVVVTERANIQGVVNEFTTWHNSRMSELAAQGKYPINGPFEVRMCKVDDDAEVLVESAGPPNLSAVRPRPDHPEWDTCIWMNVVTLPGTPGAAEYFREMERWMAQHYSGDYATFGPSGPKAGASPIRVATVTTSGSARPFRPRTRRASRRRAISQLPVRRSMRTIRTASSRTASTIGCCRSSAAYSAAAAAWP